MPRDPRLRPQRVASTYQGSQHRLPAGTLAAMLAAQHEMCALCHSKITMQTAIIDHDHLLAVADGHDAEHGCPRCVRALLCRRCNGLLGFAQDDPGRLRRAAVYIELARANHR